MSDLTTFARDTERRVAQPPFETLLWRQRRVRRRRAAWVSAAAVAAVLALAFAVSGLGRLGAQSLPAAPTPRLTSVSVPDWTADEVVGHPDAFVAAQLESRTDRRIVLTVWKRCVAPRPDHDCLGREAIAVVDGTDDRFLVLGAVTGSSEQPSMGGPGLYREVGDGVWYWAHRGPGPYLLSATMRQPVALTVMDHPVAPPFGTSTVECADGAGLCTLDVNARTLERLAVPNVPDGHTRWATPTSKGCGIWGLTGAGGDLRLVIQQRDGSFASADLPGDATPTSLAEGGAECEVAYYQSTADTQDQLVVSLDQGSTWQARRAPLPQLSGNIEEKPRLRVLIPPRWAALPEVTSPSGLPGPLKPL
ncbi:hypothetical protein ASE25_15950 [Terrabacter sp. Root85]|uniref:hypothetical protein n=1 Tax=Terrabacter sp. Root85 TaxID=1736603 RepID=UPI0006FB5FF1|nr:hypothetical protein [Terrabacter sp. Root85]KRC88325.1 hypothetical protein ASE25_15950 [Terrabacter sp. Root85]